MCLSVSTQIFPLQHSVSLHIPLKCQRSGQQTCLQRPPTTHTRARTRTHKHTQLTFSVIAVAGDNTETLETRRISFFPLTWGAPIQATSPRQSCRPCANLTLRLLLHHDRRTGAEPRPGQRTGTSHLKLYLTFKCFIPS